MLKVVGASWNKIRASTWIIGIVFVFGIVVVILGELGQSDEDGNWSATVYWSKESGFEIVFWGQGKKFEEVPKGAARAYYQSHVNTTGWAILEIETQADYPDWVQAFGAGMLEGSLTWQMIDWQRQNTLHSVCKEDESLCEDLREYIEENMKWVKQMYGNKSDSYWHQIYLFYLQLEGVQKGFEQGVKRSRANDVEEMTVEDFLWLNSLNDLEDLKYKFAEEDDEDEPTLGSLTHSTLLQKLKYKRSINYSFGEQKIPSAAGKKSGNEMESKYKCGHENLSLSSAFVKLVPEDGKLFVAHNSAGDYSSMLKMLKHYQFPYRRSKRDRETVAGKRITFSSYPGVIHSIDDFFIIRNDVTKQELVIAGVPLPVFNDDLWGYLSPAGQVLAGPRIMAANRLASNGKDWAAILSKHNSGTGNKEWVIADFMKFEKIASLKDEDEELYRRQLEEAEGLLYVAEQLPGAFQVEDKSDVLKSATYWASYGLPYFEVMSNISGIHNMIDEHGEVYSYENAPVAKIFRRDQFNATDMTSIAKLMRSNFYKTDPYSYKNPRCAVGGRGDLDSDMDDPAPLGVTDTKIYSSRRRHSESESDGDGDGDKAPRDENFQAKAGPPYSDSWNVVNRTVLPGESDRLGPFAWPESEFEEVPHFGHPDVWNFQPIVVF